LLNLTLVAFEKAINERQLVMADDGFVNPQSAIGITSLFLFSKEHFQGMILVIDFSHKKHYILPGCNNGNGREVELG